MDDDVAELQALIDSVWKKRRVDPRDFEHLVKMMIHMRCLIEEQRE